MTTLEERPAASPEPERNGAPATRPPLFKPRAAGWRAYAEPTVIFAVFFILAIAPLVPLFDFTNVFNSSTGYGRGNLGLVLVYTISAMGFNLLIGWSGQIGLAHAGLMALGAYATTVLFADGVPFFAAMLIAAIAATVIGVVVGFPAARLRGFFLAIATLALGELIVKMIELDDDIAGWLDTGGGTGRTVPTFQLGGGTNTLTAYYIALGALLVVFIVFMILTRGRLGRTLKSIRDIEVATGPIGISATRYKLIAFGLSAFAAALSGALFAQNVTFINPEAFRTRLLIFMLIILIVGGVGRLWGPLLGAIFFVFIREKLQDAEKLRILIFGISLMLAILMLPGGFASLPSRIRESKWAKDLQRRLENAWKV